MDIDAGWLGRAEPGRAKPVPAGSGKERQPAVRSRVAPTSPTSQTALRDLDGLPKWRDELSDMAARFKRNSVNEPKSRPHIYMHDKKVKGKG